MSYRFSRQGPRRGMFFVTLLASTSLLIAAVSAQASTLPTVSIAVNSSSITVGGTLQSGGVNVVSTATGVKEASVILFLLKPGVSVSEFYAALGTKGSDPNGAGKYGSLVFDAEAAPGKGSEVQTNLQPGQYVALLAPREGPPKIHTTFAVTAAKSPATLPTPQATVRAIDFDFRGPATLHNGELVRFENEGFLVHMDFALPTKSKKAAKQLVKALLTGKEKQAFKLVVGPPVSFAGPVSSGAYQQETIAAKPGWYVEVCFMETQEKQSHTRLGMERIIKITK
jgi:hypothetical protein